MMENVQKLENFRVFEVKIKKKELPKQANYSGGNEYQMAQSDILDLNLPDPLAAKSAPVKQPKVHDEYQMA